MQVRILPGALNRPCMKKENNKKSSELDSLKPAAEKKSKKTKVPYYVTGTTAELQQPLQAVLLKVSSLIAQYKDRDFEYIGFKEYQKIIQTLISMRDQIKYCCDTTNRLAEIQKRKAGVDSKVSSLNEAVANIVGHMEHQIVIHEINVRIKYGKNLPQVVINLVDLNQIVTNILHNAIQSMPAGGDVQIKTSHYPSKGMVRLEVKDDGVGIQKDNLKDIFEPFYTTKRRGIEKNSGLGLTIVHSIVKACHGDISISSNLRTGTTVTVLLPTVKKISKKKLPVKND